MNTKLFLFLIFLLTFVAYFPSLFVPFYLDDLDSIVNNPTFNNGNVGVILQAYGLRAVGYLSLYGNYLISPDNTLGYHIVNISIHLLNGLVIYKLCYVICDFLKVPVNKSVVLIVLAVWLLHPLNTQAVTYIVQRLASLATLFTLFSLLCYLYWRTSYKPIWIVLSTISFALAIFTKQNVVFLPLFIFLVEITFSSSKIKQKLFVFSLLLFFSFALLYPFMTEFLQKIDLATREIKTITRLDYFNTQLFVHWLYLKKFLLIEPLTLTIDVDLIKDEVAIFWSYLLHTLILLSAWLLRKRYKLITFSVLFFYTAHLVESSLIPITDLAFEHRTYMANIALSFIFVALLKQLIMKLKLPDKVFVGISCVVIIFLAITTFYRNQLWQQPKAFFEHDFQQAPNNPRNLEVIGQYYAKNGELDNAVDLLSKSLNINFKKGRLTVSSVTNLMKVYTEQGNYQGAVITGQKSMFYLRSSANKSKVLSAMAFVYTKMQMCDFAIGLASTAKKLNSNNQEAKQVLAFCNEKNG